MAGKNRTVSDRDILNTELLALIEYARHTGVNNINTKKISEENQTNLQTAIIKWVECLNDMGYDYDKSGSLVHPEDQEDVDAFNKKADQVGEGLAKLVYGACVNNDALGKLYGRLGSLKSIVANDKRLNDHTNEIHGTTDEVSATARNFFIPSSIVHKYERFMRADGKNVNMSDVLGKAIAEGGLCNYDMGQENPNGCTYIDG